MLVMNTVLRKTIQYVMCTLGILVGLTTSTVLATVILEPSLTLGKIDSWIGGNVPTSVIVLANQGLGTTFFYGMLLLVIAGALAFRILDNRRIAAERKAAGL